MSARKSEVQTGETHVQDLIRDAMHSVSNSARDDLLDIAEERLQDIESESTRKQIKEQIELSRTETPYPLRSDE